MDPANQLFGGRYRIVGEVGRGGMGVIYRGIDTILDREVAIKVMSADFADAGEEARARFLREAKAAAKLQHRNIVTVFEFAEQDGVSYIVMEFLKGKSLAARLAADSPMTIEQKLDVMTELCNGLQFAHENGVIHRDVKPANVWILDDGAVKLVDFGIAKISSSMMTMRGDVMGSAAYMSPEQIEGQSITGRSDVFSAAVVLYEMLARKRPFEGDSPTATMMQIVHVPPPPIESLVPGLPPELVAAVAKGLAKNPDERHQSAADFGAELQLIRMGLPRSEETVLIAQPPASDSTIRLNTLPLKSEPLPSKDPTGAMAPAAGPSMWTYVAGGAAVLAAVVGLSMWLGRDTPPERPEVPGGGDAGAVTTGTGGSVVEPREFRVESKPSRAEVFVDGESVGRTPLPVRLIAGASIRLQAPGYEPLTETIGSADLDRGSRSYELQRVVEPAPQMVKVTLSGSYPFEVRENGRTFREASEHHEFSAQAGRTFSMFSDKYFLNKPITIRVQRGGSVEESAPELGEVYFKGDERCQIFRGERSLNAYVKQELGPMASGPHDFRFLCPDGPRTKRVVILPNQRVEHDVR